MKKLILFFLLFIVVKSSGFEPEFAIMKKMQRYSINGFPTWMSNYIKLGRLNDSKMIVSFGSHCYSGIQKSIDGGYTWQTVYFDSTSFVPGRGIVRTPILRDVHYFENGIVYVDADSNRVIKSTDDGLTWKWMTDKSDDSTRYFILDADNVLKAHETLINKSYKYDYQISRDGMLTWSDLKLPDSLMQAYLYTAHKRPDGKSLLNTYQDGGFTKGVGLLLDSNFKLEKVHYSANLSPLEKKWTSTNEAYFYHPVYMPDCMRIYLMHTNDGLNSDTISYFDISTYSIPGGFDVHHKSICIGGRYGMYTFSNDMGITWQTKYLQLLCDGIQSPYINSIHMLDDQTALMQCEYAIFKITFKQSGVEDFTNSEYAKLLPNITSRGSINIKAEINLPAASNLGYTIHDINGRIIDKRNIGMHDQGKSIIDINNVNIETAGIYFITFDFCGVKQSMKLIVE